jgi:hypothetical protein
MNKKLLNKYNTKDSLIVISSYPKKKEKYSQGVCAVSSFTKNTLMALKEENKDRKIVVLTMVIDKEETYVEDGILIVRCFKRNSPLSYFGLIKQIMAFGKAKDVMVEFEFASFGNTLMTGLLAPVVWMIRLTGKNITLVSHQVVSDISDLSGHIGLSASNPMTKILNYSLKGFYKLICFPAKKVVVLEEEFKTRLGKLINKDKIMVIPHGIDTDIANTKKKDARKAFGIKQNEFVILYFGYLTWYKGVDFLINALKNVDSINGKKIRLVIAGGPSFTQEEKTHYQNFISKVEKAVKNSKNVILTGFVKEEDIAPIFKMADLSVFPYRTFMSSSGPLSLAISHSKAFILSENLGALANSPDIKRALNLAKIDKNEIVFKLNKKNLIKTITMSMEPKMKRKMLFLSKTLNEERSFTKIASMYDKVILENNNKKTVNAFFNAVSPNNS